MIFPDKLDVLTVQARLIAETGGTTGLRDEALFESALAAAENRHHYEAADVVACAAAYAFHLTQAHAFIDGNKRTGFVVCAVFLERNGYELVASEEDATVTTLALAAGEMKEPEYASCLERNTRQMRRR